MDPLTRTHRYLTERGPPVGSLEERQLNKQRRIEQDQRDRLSCVGSNHIVQVVGKPGDGNYDLRDTHQTNDGKFVWCKFAYCPNRFNELSDNFRVPPWATVCISDQEPTIRHLHPPGEKASGTTPDDEHATVFSRNSLFLSDRTRSHKTPPQILS